MSLEHPLFGSREGREEVLSGVSKSPEVQMPNTQESLPPQIEQKIESQPLYQGRIDVDRSNSEPMKPRRPIGFSPPEKITQPESPMPVPGEGHDLRLRPEEPEIPPIQSVPEKPPVSPIPESSPVQSTTEKPVFTDLEKPKPKQTFGELKSESLEDYADLVEGIKTKIREIKDKTVALAKLSAEETGIAPVYRGSKSAMEKMTKTAFMVRSISQYGWWRLGKEATMDAVKRKAEELVLRKGLKYVLDNLSQRPDILDAVSKQLEQEAGPLKTQLAEIIAIKKQLET